jgi:hypothetical protein
MRLLGRFSAQDRVADARELFPLQVESVRRVVDHEQGGLAFVLVL